MKQTQTTDRISQHSTGKTRRTVLRTLGVGAIAGLAGCLGDSESADNGGSSGDGTIGTAEISFLDQSYVFDDASCEGSRTFPPENEQIHYRDYSEAFEFWVERYDPEQSDVVEVHLRFPSGSGQTIGEVEGYEGKTSMDDVEFELDSHTRGSALLEPGSDMNDDVEHDPDGGVVEWDISC